MTKSTKTPISISASKSCKSLPEAINTHPHLANKFVNSESTSTSSTPRAHSKIVRLLGLLRGGTGASLEEMCEATGWQAHSVRAALTGLRKRGHAIERYVEGNTTLWRIGEPAAAEVPA